VYIYKTFNPSEPVRKVRYWATKEARQEYIRYQFRENDGVKIDLSHAHVDSNKHGIVEFLNEELAKACLQINLSLPTKESENER
jgi:hypothetical protein